MTIRGVSISTGGVANQRSSYTGLYIALDSKKIEGTKTPNVIHHTRREGHTGLNHTIKPCIGCSRE